MHGTISTDPSSSLGHFVKAVNESFSLVPGGGFAVMFPIAAIQQILAASLLYIPKKEDPKLDTQLGELVERVRWGYDPSPEQGDLLSQILFARVLFNPKAWEYAESKIEWLERGLQGDYRKFERNNIATKENPKGRLLNPAQQLDRFRRELIQMATYLERGGACPGFSATEYQSLSVFSDELLIMAQRISNVNFLAYYARNLPYTLDPKKTTHDPKNYGAVAAEARALIKRNRWENSKAAIGTLVAMVPSEAVVRSSTHFDWACLGVTYLPHTLGKLPFIEEISLSHNRLDAFPKQLLKVGHVRVLKLNHNQIKKLPEKISKVWGLTCLQLCNNQLTELPESFSQLVNLAVLHLNFNPLKTYPPVLTQMPSLKMLNLEYTRLSTFPDLANHTDLTDLNIGGNSFAEISVTIGHLTNLRKLSIEASGSLEGIAPLAQLSGLEELFCDSQMLYKFPPGPNFPILRKITCGTEILWQQGKGESLQNFFERKRTAPRNLW